MDTAHATLRYEDNPEPRLERSGYELPLSVRVTIGRMSREGSPIGADRLLRWYAAHPDYSLRTPATRAFPEFRALFEQLVDERFPEGMPVPVSKRILRAQYHAASSEFVSDLEEFIGQVPDISRISRPLNVGKNHRGRSHRSFGQIQSFPRAQPRRKGHHRGPRAVAATTLAAVSVPGG